MSSANTRTLFVASEDVIEGLVVRLVSLERMITLDRFVREDDGYRQTQYIPYGQYEVLWAATVPNVQNTYLTVEFDDVLIQAGDNVTVEESGDVFTISSSGGGGGDTGTVIDGGMADSTYDSITPIDGGSA